MKNDYTLSEVKAVMKNALDGHIWMLGELHDERRDILHDPECKKYLPEVNQEIARERAVIDELEDLISHLADYIDDMRFQDEYEQRMFG